MVLRLDLDLHDSNTYRLNYVRNCLFRARIKLRELISEDEWGNQIFIDQAKRRIDEYEEILNHLIYN